LAKGGSGDVLAGMLVSILVQYPSLYRNTDGFYHEYCSIIRESVCSTISLFYSTAEKLQTLYETPAITPSLIIKNLFRKIIS
jgi:NAD(P)H-hydrate repair Nnr-like enzyme with NAD(P)H-hydrate dehydratase domain